jgi:hypothetical protein
VTKPKRGFMKLRALSLTLVLIMTLQPVDAQHVINGCGGGDPPPSPSPTPTPTPTPTPATCPTNIGSNGPIFTSWGMYFWQVDLARTTATFSSEVDFTTNPGGLVSIRIPGTGSLPCNITVHRLHGSLVLEAQQQNGGSCTANSIVAQVLDQNGNALASGSLAQFAPSQSDLLMRATFNSPLTVSNFILQLNINPGCISGLSWQLVMN